MLTHPIATVAAIAALLGAVSVAQAQSDNERQDMLRGGATKKGIYNIFGLDGTGLGRTTVTAIQRAVAISRQPIFPKKDALAVFDISQPSANKRFYLLDFTSSQVTAHFAAHGRTNGPTTRATKFKGFQQDFDMVPLGPLKTTQPEVMEQYRTIVDRYDGTIYRNMIVAILEGVTPYNRYINHTPPYKWIIHPNWYTTAGFRAKHNGILGRSNGCITVDPAENNKLITRLQGALIYVTVGDAPIEQYLQ